MGATTYYAYPYPDAGSTVDVPRDIKALAEKLELMKNGLTIPTGSLTAQNGVAIPTGDLNLGVAGANDTVSRTLLWHRADGADRYTLGAYMHGSGAAYAMSFVMIKNGAEVSRFRLNADNSVATGVSATMRPIPFAVYATSVTVPVTASVVGTVVHNFNPSTRFSTAPLVQLTSLHGAYGTYVGAVSATSVTVGVRHFDNTSGTTSVVVHVLAIQMLSDSGAG